MQERASKRSQGRGFGVTLFEVLVALVALAAVSSIAVPAWFSRPEVTLDSAVRLLTRDLRWAQDRAVFDQRPVAVRFSPDGNGYRVLNGRGAPLRAPLGGGDFERDYERDAVFQGVRIASIDLTGGGQSVRYDERGQLEAGGTLVLSFRGEERTLILEAPSGRVEALGLAEPWGEPGH